MLERQFEISIICKSDLVTTNYDLLEKLYERVKTYSKIKSEFILASCDEDSVVKSISFSDKHFNMACTKGNSWYNSYKNALYLANYNVTLVVDNLTEAFVNNFDLEKIVKDADTYTGLTICNLEDIGFVMRTYYLKNIFMYLKFKDADIYDALLGVCQYYKDFEVNSKNKRVYQKYKKKGLKLSRLLGVA